MKPTKLALLGCFLAAPAFAVSSNGYVQQQGQDPQAPVHTPRQKGDFSDFDTVEVLCSADTSGDYIATALCTLTNDIARDKGRDAGLRVVPGGGRERSDSFTLFVRVSSAGTAPRAVSVRVEASRYYERAIDQEAGHNEPASFPRRGKLVMYEETVTGVGQGDNLEMNMRANLKKVLNGFFVRLEGQRD